MTVIWPCWPWLQSAGKSLPELTLYGFAVGDRVTVRSMLKALEENCHALRRLDISRTQNGPLMRAVLKKTRGRLEELITSLMDVRPVKRYCAGLRKLLLDAASGSINGLLRVVGPTLEEIVCLEEWTRTHFEQVQKYRLNLSRIELFAEGDDDLNAYVDLLCSYGANLRFTRLGKMTTTICLRIATSCPNVRCSLTSNKFKVLLAMIEILGPLVVLFVMDLSDVDYKPEEVETVSRCTSGLEEIMLRAKKEHALSVVTGFYSHNCHF